MIKILRQKAKNLLIKIVYYVYRRCFYAKKIHNILLKEIIINEFHKLFYYSERSTWLNTYWLNIPTQKNPLDLWIYQEIIFETKPDLIIETGTYMGGSGLFLASTCELLNRGRVITIDINKPINQVNRKRLEYITGPSTALLVIQAIKKRIHKNMRVMVILDSNHSREHVLNELRLYSEFVTKGNYLIVEDTNLKGHPVIFDEQPELDPKGAVDTFLKENHQYIIDRKREKFLLTFFPGGFLRKRY